MSRKRVLIVDDHAGARFGIRDFLESHEFVVTEGDSCATAEESFRAARPDIAVLDYNLPDGTALDLMHRLREIDGSVPLVVLTAHGSIELAVQAMRAGAEHFLTKPLDMPTLLLVIQRTVEQSRLRQRELAQASRDARQSADPVFGVSERGRLLGEHATKFLAAESPILIQGETGAGKGVLARWLHEHGPRAKEPFVDLNCAGLSRELLESELFGYERGAFTGAVSAKVGLLEVAHRGTLFLDEIGDVDLQVQPKLLKVLEEKRYRRLGDVRDRTADVRLIAATHRDLAAMVRDKQFRADLYFRINTVPLMVPPLRERLEDIPLLAAQFLARLAKDLGRNGLELAPDAIDALRSYSWPGNVRELRNVLERAILLSGGGTLHRHDLLFDASADSATEDSMTLEEVERRHIERVVRLQKGQVDKAAKLLGVPRSTLYQKLKKFGIPTAKS